ncbi:MAG: hypothetical protein HYX69_16620 [Planctomycetia bacterium]|nr:hypothetical protein [Planctomycetia bacterium]
MNNQSKTRHASTARRHSIPEAVRQPADDLVGYVRHYAKERPEVVALWCFGIGFVLGWKLKPW